MYGDRGNVISKIWYKNDLVYRDSIGLPAHISYFEDGLLKNEEWYNEDGKRHRDGDLPASIHYSEYGSVWLEEWYKNGVLYNEHRNMRDD